MDRYTIADLEKLTGIMAGTIRIWERRYRIIKPHRTATNRRWYDDEDLKRIINISILYRHGIKISKIAGLTGPQIAEQVAIMTKDTSDSDTQIDSLIIGMADFNEDAINDILLKSIITRGFEETFENIVFPFLRRVGIMWHTGSTDIGAEHFVSNIFRKRLIAAIDTLPRSDNPDSKRVILYLPENELHEMGLLLYTFTVVKAGHKAVYLGQSTPFGALADVAERWHANIIITGTLTALPVGRPEDYLNRLSSTYRDKKILVSGTLAITAIAKPLPNIFAITSASDLRKHL